MALTGVATSDFVIDNVGLISSLGPDKRDHCIGRGASVGDGIGGRDEVVGTAGAANGVAAGTLGKRSRTGGASPRPDVWKGKPDVAKDGDMGGAGATPPAATNGKSVGGTLGMRSRGGESLLAGVWNGKPDAPSDGAEGGGGGVAAPRGAPKIAPEGGTLGNRSRTGGGAGLSVDGKDWKGKPEVPSGASAAGSAVREEDGADRAGGFGGFPAEGTGIVKAEVGGTFGTESRGGGTSERVFGA